MSGLREVLAAHLEAWPAEEGIGWIVGWSCECGLTTTDEEDVDRGKQWHADHVARAVTAFLLERLDVNEVREAVSCAIASPQLPNRHSRRYATAALAAVKSALGGADQ